MTATWQDEKVSRLVAEHGLAGYGLWWRVAEIVASRVEGNSAPSVTYPISTWSHLLVTRGSLVISALSKLAVTHLVTMERHGSDITVTIPNLLKYRDEYSRKSGHTPESVGSKKQIQNTDTEAEKTPAPSGVDGVLPFPDLISEDDLIESTAKRLCERHPKQRTCGPAEARKNLKAIIGKLPKSERAAKLEQIDRNHEGWCKSEPWTKDGGEYAKGLANWLAPTMGRFNDPPPARASPCVPNPVKYFDPRSITG